MNMENPFGESLQNPLEKYGRDITKAVKDGKVDPVIGRDEEVRSITRILSRKTKNMFWINWICVASDTADI